MTQPDTQKESFLERFYRSHHAQSRGDGFVLLGEDRGAFIRQKIGTRKKVLDIGCRDGALTKQFATGNTVLGIDIDSSALARAHESLGIDTKHVDLHASWGLPKNHFDAVVAAEVVEHLYFPREIFKKVHEVLRPGGVFVGTVPNAFSLINRVRYALKKKAGTPLSDPTHINHFVVNELKQLLEESFQDVQVEGIGRLGFWAKTFPQTFAFDLCFSAHKPL